MVTSSDTIAPLKSQACYYTTACAVEVYGAAKAQEAVPVQPALAAIVLLSFLPYPSEQYQRQPRNIIARHRIYYIIHTPLSRFLQKLEVGHAASKIKLWGAFAQAQWCVRQSAAAGFGVSGMSTKPRTPWSRMEPLKMLFCTAMLRAF
jgi:hypothetical protein